LPSWGESRESRGERVKVSLPGVLERAASACRRSTDERDHGLGFSLLELLDHLEQVRADPERVGEFFELWVGK